MNKPTSYILFFEVWGYSKKPEKKGSKAICIAAWKEISLPFVPSTGINISIESIPLDHLNAEFFEAALKRTSILVTGIFEIQRVHISFNNEGQMQGARLETSLLCDWGDYPKINEVNAAVDQLVYGYGFKRFREIQS